MRNYRQRPPFPQRGWSIAVLLGGLCLCRIVSGAAEFEQPSDPPVPMALFLAEQPADVERQLPPSTPPEELPTPLLYYYAASPAQETLTFTPTDDATVRSDAPADNLGAAIRLELSDAPTTHILLRFLLSGVEGRTITRAVLRLYALNAAPHGGIAHRVSDQPWAEESVTWETAPAYEEASVATLGATTAAAWSELEITPVVTTDGLLSVAITAAPATDVHYSAEEGAEEWRPVLVVTVVGRAPQESTSAPSPPELALDPASAPPYDVPTWDDPRNAVSAREARPHSGKPPQRSSTAASESTTIAPATPMQLGLLVTPGHSVPVVTPGGLVDSGSTTSQSTSTESSSSGNDTGSSGDTPPSLPPPTIVSLTPISGPSTGGTAVTISGSDIAAQTVVTFGDAPATDVTFLIAGTQVRVTTPPHTAGVVHVTITNPDGQSGTLVNGYTYEAPPPTIPSAPAHLTATAIASNHITLTWSDNAGDEDGFELERSATDGAFSRIALIVPNSTTYQDTALHADTTYWYRVRAVNTAGPSNYSNVASTTTLDIAPAAPTNLTTQAIASNQIDLVWDDTSDNEDGFELERAEGDAPFQPLVTVGPDVTTHHDVTLNPATTYTYRVRAVNAIGASAYSNIASATTADEPPEAPTSLTAEAVSSSQIDLAWEDAADTEDGFELERSIAVGSFNLLTTLGPNVTTYRDGALDAETTYYYRVRAANDVGASDYSNTASATTFEAPPAPPTNLTAAAVSASQIDLTWDDEAENEDGVEIERLVEGGSFSPLATIGPNMTTYSDTGLSASTTYAYRVRAVNDIGASDYSNTASATTLEAPPAAPTDLAAVAVGADRIALSWQDHADNEDRFDIERATTGQPFALVATVGPNITSYQDEELEAATTYAYRVRAVNSAGASDYSNVASAMTADVPPEAPTNLTAEAISAGAIDLEWEDESDNEEGFELERAEEEGPFTLLVVVGTDVTRYSDTGLEAATTYAYRIRAVNAVGPSDYSNTASATTADVPPETPAHLTAEALSASAIDLEWEDASENEDGFEVERSLDGANFGLLVTVAANVTTYSDTGLSASTTYSYRVRAMNAAGPSGYSNVANATTPSADNALYVSASDGNDAYPGTEEQPFKTIQRAADVVQAGQTVYIRAGTYHERVIVKSSGLPDQYITFTNYPGELVVIDGEKSIPVEEDDWKGLMNIYQHDFIRLRGLTLRNSQRYGIYVSSTVDHIDIDNNVVEWSNDGGIVIGCYEGCGSHVVVSNNTVRHNNDEGLTAEQEAISLYGVEAFEVMYNHVYENKEEGIDLKRGSTNGQVHHNHVHHNNGPNIYVDSANTIAIYNNEIHHATGSTKAGLTLGVEAWPDSRETTYGIDVYNNLIYENPTGLRFYVASDAKDYATIAGCRLFNNTIYANGPRGGFWVYGDHALALTGNEIYNNIFWENDTDWAELRDSTSQSFDGYTIHHNLFQEGATSDTLGTVPVLTTNVSFVDAANDDFHLLGDSPAIDAGTDVGAPSADFDDVGRPVGVGFDLGAYEYPGPLLPPRIAAAGDIACGTDTVPGLPCQQMETSDLLLQMQPDAVLALGDTQYEAGASEDYLAFYDPSWGRLKAITRPVPGNHEYATDGAAGYFDYFNGVGQPTGPAGDRDQGYYTFDLGEWRVYALNSNCEEVGGCHVGSPQTQWLRTELATHPTACSMLVMHHPLWSSVDGKARPEVQPLVQAFYEAGGEFMLAAHAHVYERFAQQHPSGFPAPGRGVRQIVVGTGGKNLHAFGESVAPNSEVRDDETFGVLKVTLHPTRYEWEFAPIAGEELTDWGTTACYGADDVTAPTAPTDLNAESVGGSRVDLTWRASTDDYGVAGYQIYRGGVYLDTTPETSYADATVAPQTTYAYTVVTLDLSGNASAPSEPATVTTAPPDIVLTFIPTDDATIRASNPTSNYGTSTRLEADNDSLKQFLLKFRFTGLGDREVISATLRLYAVDPSNHGGVFHHVPDLTWTEETVTWNTAPAHDAGIIGTLGPVTTDTWYAVDVTSLVTGDGLLSLKAISPSSDGADYSSKEGPADVRPALVVRLVDDGSTPGPSEVTCPDGAGYLDFAGLTWEVKSGFFAPGPNFWSASCDSVWVDREGQLHLKIRQEATRWYSAEVKSIESFGYGDYLFKLATNVEDIDPNVIVGLFTYLDDSHEIDFEFSRWGNPTIDAGQYVIQPYFHAGNVERFALHLTDVFSTHSYDWQEDSIFFQSYHGHHTSLPGPAGDKIHDWTYTGADNPPDSSERVHLNYWLYQGKPPQNGLDTEVVISDFRYTAK